RINGICRPGSCATGIIQSGTSAGTKAARRRNTTAGITGLVIISTSTGCFFGNRLIVRRGPGCLCDCRYRGNRCLYRRWVYSPALVDPPTEPSIVPEIQIIQNPEKPGALNTL